MTCSSLEVMAELTLSLSSVECCYRSANDGTAREYERLTKDFIRSRIVK